MVNVILQIYKLKHNLGIFLLIYSTNYMKNLFIHIGNYLCIKAYETYSTFIFKHCRKNLSQWYTSGPAFRRSQSAFRRLSNKP